VYNNTQQKWINNGSGSSVTFSGTGTVVGTWEIPVNEGELASGDELRFSLNVYPSGGGSGFSVPEVTKTYSGTLVLGSLGTFNITSTTVSGTADVTINGVRPYSVQIAAYTTSTFTGSSIGYAYLSNYNTGSGATSWTMAIPQVTEAITLYFQLGVQVTEGGYWTQYNSGVSKAVSSGATTVTGVTIAKAITAGEDPNGTPGNGDETLSGDIDSALLGTWKNEEQKAGETVITEEGSLITVTFASDGTITWGGSAGSTLNATTSAYQGTGYQFVWIATNGKISYKFMGPNISVQTIDVYGYTINGDGKLELSSALVPGTVFATLVKR
jgi:hypothetical protein